MWSVVSSGEWSSCLRDTIRFCRTLCSSAVSYWLFITQSCSLFEMDFDWLWLQCGATVCGCDALFMEPVAEGKRLVLTRQVQWVWKKISKWEQTEHSDLTCSLQRRVKYKCQLYNITRMCIRCSVDSFSCLIEAAVIVIVYIKQENRAATLDGTNYFRKEE